MTIISWNVNGWTETNKNLRGEIITQINADIVCLGETHLKDTCGNELNNYTWYGFNRDKIHVRANRGSGGVGILYLAPTQ